MGHVRQKLLRRAASVPVIGVEAKPERSAGLAADGEAQLAAAALEEADPPVQLEPDPLLEGLRPVLDDLIRALADREAAVRLAAVHALELMGAAAAPAAAGLTQVLADPDRILRWASARTLGKIGPVKGVNPVPGLARLLCDPDLDLQLAGAGALERYGPAAAAAVPALAGRVVRGDAEIRTAAMRALEAVGTDARPAIPALVTALSDGDARVRRAAAQVLGRFGPLARDAAPALRQALDDPDADVRRAASEALLSVLPAGE
jgi:HEAT repeat protein